MDKPRQVNDEVVIHAMCAELWLGSQPIAMTQPQHTVRGGNLNGEGVCPSTAGVPAPKVWQWTTQRY
ncbi:MAG TPA: hypothetical protein V6C78_15870 [Crinalium sp.]